MCLPLPTALQALGNILLNAFTPDEDLRASCKHAGALQEGEEGGGVGK